MATVNVETRVIVVTEDYLRQVIREELAHSTAYVPPVQGPYVPRAEIVKDDAVAYNPEYPNPTYTDVDPTVAIATSGAQPLPWK